MAGTWWVMGVTPACMRNSSYLRSLPFIVGTSQKCFSGGGGVWQNLQASEQTDARKDEREG